MTTDDSTTTPAALPPVRSEPLFSISQFRAALVRHGVVDAAAIMDPGGYDGWRTMKITRMVYDELMENKAI